MELWRLFRQDASARGTFPGGAGALIAGRAILTDRRREESVVITCTTRRERLPLDLTCHVFPHAAASGPANMALDEALLEWVAGGASTACLRTYGWTTPTLSLGYFQRLAEAQADPRFQSVPVVRRLTGGGAIWHHHEVTYALVVAANHPLARPSTGLYRAVHAAIASALCAAGIAAARRGGGRIGVWRPETAFIMLYGYRSGRYRDRWRQNRRQRPAQAGRSGAPARLARCWLVRVVRPSSLVSATWRTNRRGIMTGRIACSSAFPSALGLQRRRRPGSGSRSASAASELERARYQNPAWTGLR